jgi:hypothetical protein
MSSLSIRVGIVDTTGEADAATLTAVAAALNVQVTRDLPQFWNVTASVEYLPNKNSIPQGIWPVQLVKSLPPGEGGFHLTKKTNQPYAKVIYTPKNLDWTIDASHETLEMLVDPSGNRLQASTAIAISGDNVVDNPSQKYEYLVELCDPCEADNYAYSIDGIAVSDFITPHFYDNAETPGTRYSFTGAIKRPRQVLPGGYISFINEAQSEWQQILWLDAAPQLNNLGPASGASIREFVEQKTHHKTHERMAKARATAGGVGGAGNRAKLREWRASAGVARAKHYT